MRHSWLTGRGFGNQVHQKPQSQACAAILEMGGVSGRAPTECAIQTFAESMADLIPAGSRKIPANVRCRRSRSEPVDAIVFFSFDTGLYRRVKAGRRIEPGGKTSGRPSRQPVILFIALPLTEDKSEPG